MRSTLSAKPKANRARLIHRVELNPETCLLTFAAFKAPDPETPDLNEFSFLDRGGQYIIIDTGLLTADGRPLKRAYSLLPTMLPLGPGGAGGVGANPWLEPGEIPFTLGIYRLPTSDNVSEQTTVFGSQKMFAATLGSVFSFSGPWGRMAPDSEGVGDPVPALIVAAGTGITGGLGMFCSKPLNSVYRPMHLVWLDTGGFLEPPVVTEVIQTHLPEGAEACRRMVRVPVEGGCLPAANGLPWRDWLETQGVVGSSVDCYYLGDGRFYPSFHEWVQGKTARGLTLKKEFYYHRPTEGGAG